MIKIAKECEICKTPFESRNDVYLLDDKSVCQLCYYREEMTEKVI